jgi:hypothetical protein
LVRVNLILVRILLCDISDPFGCDGIQRRHHRSPAVAASPSGRDPARAKRPINGSHSDADQSPSRPDLIREMANCGAETANTLHITSDSYGLLNSLISVVR